MVQHKNDEKHSESLFKTDKCHRILVFKISSVNCLAETDFSVYNKGLKLINWSFNVETEKRSFFTPQIDNLAIS